MPIKHTPGPWTYCPEIGHAGEIRAGSTRIANVCAPSMGPRQEDRGNGALLASAPELLEALEQSLAWTVDLITSGDAGFWDEDKDPNVIRMRAAIAKAKGE